MSSPARARRELSRAEPLRGGMGDRTTNVTFDVDTSKWFVKDGARLDPRDAANRAAIEANLRSSINAFQDDDGLGHENHDLDDDHGSERDGDGDGDGGHSGPGGGDDGSGHH